MKGQKLTQGDREFFRLVNQVAFCNPFSEQLERLNCRLADTTPDVSEEETKALAIGKVLERLAALERTGGADLRLYSVEESELLRYALLFAVYSRFIEDFDHLIAEQIEAGDIPCSVPFAKECLALLRSRGFAPADARRYFAFFYQIRRAFYFIHQGLVGQSSSMRRLRCHLWDNVFTSNIRWYERFLWNRMEDFSTMLLGETGTGKGTAAAAIGRSGFIPFDDQAGRFAESFTRNFLEVNLSQLPETLIESELFGHKKGAFTGAVEDYEGLFARCSPHGTIFLDEIGDLSLHVQVKLLQVLQGRIFSPVGSRIQQRFSGRVIAATNHPLDKLRREGAFRDDFFYRLCSDVIVVPPLRQRIREEPAEMSDLLFHVAERILGEPAPELILAVEDLLHQQPGDDYRWPGNVRELEQAVRRILLTRAYHGDRHAPGTEDDLPALLHRAIEENDLSAQELLSGYCLLLHQRYGTYEEVARITGLDRRTVKKYIDNSSLHD